MYEAIRAIACNLFNPVRCNINRNKNSSINKQKKLFKKCNYFFKNIKY